MIFKKQEKTEEKNKKPRFKVKLVSLDNELVEINRKFMRGEYEDEKNYQEDIKKNRSKFDKASNKTHVLRVSMEKPKEVGEHLKKTATHKYAQEASNAFNNFASQ